MGNLGRRTGLSALVVTAAAISLAVAFVPRAGASASVKPAQMAYACAPKVKGCTSHEAPHLADIGRGILRYDAGAPAVPVTTTLRVISRGGTTLASATVKISSGLAPRQDSLSFRSQHGITGRYDSSTGVLKLTGTSSLANYQAALRSVTYRDSNGRSPATGYRVISIQVNDGATLAPTGQAGHNLSNVARRIIKVSPNSPPVAANVSVSTDKNTAITVDVLASASDPDGDPLTVTAVNTTGTKGQVTLKPGGTVRYNPNGQFQSLLKGQTAKDTFGYTVSDGYHTASATVTVTIRGVNDPPVISGIETSPLSYQAQASPVQITSTLTISDDDDTTMSGATVSITNGFSASQDSLHFTSRSGITGSYDSATGVLTLSGNASLADYQAALRSVTFSTSDASASPAPRTVSFAVTDSVGATSTSTAQRTIDVTAAHQQPVLASIEPGTLQYDAGTPAVAVTSTLTVADPDSTTLAGATVKITSGLAPSQDELGFTSRSGITGSYDAATGVLTLSGTATLADYQAALRSVTYADPNGSTPTTGTRTISFQVNDGNAVNNLSNVVSRAIMVNPNPPPACSPVTASTTKLTSVTFGVLGSCSDSDGDTLTVVSVNTTGTKGTVTVNPGNTITYNPNGKFNYLTAGQSATDTFSYTVSDGYSTVSATVTVTINGVSVLPVISNVETTPLSYQAQAPPVPVTGTLTISDADATTLTGATVSITSGFLSGADTLAFTTQNGITGSYKASTGVLTLSGSASLASYQTALRSVTFYTSDNSASPAARTVSFAVTDSLDFTSAPVSRTIDVSAATPTAVDHTYTAVGNTPLAVGTSPSGPAATLSGSLLNGDSDPVPGATLSVVSNTAPSHGTLTVNPDGTFTYTPNPGFTGSDSFGYSIAGSSDPSVTASAVVTINVGPMVWYVNNSLSAAGNGTASAPFSTLAAANSAAGPGSTVFLYQGSGTYTGGVTMQPGESLLGQSAGLTVDGYALVPVAPLSTPVISNPAGDGIVLANNADVEGITVSGPSGNGISANGVGTATVGGTTAVEVTGAAGNGIDLSGGSGTMNFTNTEVIGNSGHSVLITGRTGGTVSFGALIADHSTGISLSDNTGATISFSGALDLGTGANTAFSATGGGTVTVTGSSNTIDNFAAGVGNNLVGTALYVQNTTIGSSGLTFQSINSDGANPGIYLDNTGTSGGLMVTGVSTTDGTGGEIQNSSGNGITLISTTSPSFTDMVIANNTADGINGTQVSGLALANSTVSGNGTQASVSGSNNDGLDFSPNGTGSPNGLTGTATITDSTITGSADNNAIISDSSGTLNLTVTGSTFSNDNSTTGNDGLHVDANGSANATVSVTGSTFLNNFGDQFQFASGSASTGTSNVTFSGNTLNTTASGVLGGGITISPYGNSHTTITVDGNNIQNSVFSGIVVDEDGATGTVTGTIHGNTIGTAANANSGSKGNDIGIFAEGTATETLSITDNNLYQYENEAGIYFLDREGSPAMNLTITGNTVADPGSFGSWGIYGEAGALSSDAGTVCLAASGNSLAGSAASGQGGYDLEVDQFYGTTVDLAGYTGSATDAATIESYLAGANSGDGTPTVYAYLASNGFPGVASCP